MSSRLTLAIAAGGLRLPETGVVAVLSPSPDTDLSALPRDRLRIVQPFRPHYDHFAGLGFECVATGAIACAAAIVCLPRAKAQARALVHRAAASASELVIVDGARTDGIDSLLRDVRARLPVGGPVSKAHGKCFWFRPDAAALADWAAADTIGPDGHVTAPGVFSADGIDPASRLLAGALPAHLGRHLADLGAGWGYLSAGILLDPQVETLDLVEADHVALDCARRNVADPRARFVWADARTWVPDRPLDAVVTNPPFHVARAADPSLGQAFIEAAARVLKPSGTLWLVANRHLPYESDLARRFADTREIAGDNRFKVLRAARPSRRRR